MDAAFWYIGASCCIPSPWTCSLKPAEIPFFIQVWEKMLAAVAPSRKVSNARYWSSRQLCGTDGHLHPRRWAEGWSTSATRTGWGSWGCSAWRRKGCGVTLEQLPVPEGADRKDGEGLSQGCAVIGQGGERL